ncbi:MAG: hypothetical protein J6D19_09505 [Clostridia bacterium]|nr:hypothetical protein [Clostridia bacterium]
MTNEERNQKITEVSKTILNFCRARTGNRKAARHQRKHGKIFAFQSKKNSERRYDYGKKLRNTEL